MGDYVERIIDRLPKLPQEEIRRLLTDMADENAMLSSIIESLPTGLVIVNKKWNIIQRNKAAIRLLFSSNFEELKADSACVWEHIEEKEISDFIKRAANESRTNVSEEFTSSGTDGSVRFLRVSVLSFVQKEQISGYIIRAEDVTSQRTQSVLMRRMENMAGLTNLAAGMAHDIKNPLGAISIHVQLIQKAVQKKRTGDGKLPDKKFLEDHLEIVNDEIQKLNDLVMDFLFAVRPVNATLILSYPAKILHEIYDLFEAEFSKEKIAFELSLSDEDKRLLIDEKLFRQVIINIVQNAVFAINQKKESAVLGFSGTFKILTYVKGDSYCVVLSDNGCGMTEEQSSRIFEPYFTTKASGTGLGMTMAYKIIKEFNGDIRVESKEGEGTKFIITLPLPQTDTKLLG